MNLKHGANKQQKASVYSFLENGSHDQITIEKIQGKEFTYPIIEDLSFAWEQISFLFTKLKNQMVATVGEDQNMIIIMLLKIKMER